MDLYDATGDASVNLFVRSLHFDFLNYVVGVPVNLIGAEDSDADERLVTLLHELEHVCSLIHPIGGILTALGLRVGDLRSLAEKRFNSWVSTLSGGIAPPQAPTPGAALESTAKAARFTRYILTVSELVLPLLEGLAISAEMELDRFEDSPSFAMIVELQHAHAMRQLQALQADRPATPDEIRAVVEASIERFEQQLARGRRRRRLLIGDSMLFRERYASDPLRSAPYFLGYLFLRRLYDEWRRHIPAMALGHFHYLATRVCCELIPLTLLTLDDDDKVCDGGVRVVERFSACLSAALALGSDDLSRLDQAGALLKIGIDGHLEDVSPSGRLPTDDDFVTLLRDWIFADTDPNSPAEADTVTMILELERAKSLSPIAKSRVVIVGLDDEHLSVFLVDPDRLVKVAQYTVTTASEGMTAFTFADRTEFDRCVAILARHGGRFGRPEPRGGRTFIVADSGVAATLDTFIWFFPEGVSAPNESPQKSTLDVVSQLTIQQGDQASTFISGPASAAFLDHKLMWHLMARGLRAKVAKSIEPDLGSLRRALSDLTMAPEEREVRHGAERELKYTGPRWHKWIKRRCRAAYVRVLFPRSTSPEALARDKFTLIQGRLSYPDAALMREVVLGGAALSASDGFSVTTDDNHMQEAVNRIRAKSTELLGVPVLCMDVQSRHIRLDLTPVVAG